MNNQHYDLIVIGGGSGGLAAAEKAAGYGRKVAIIEANRLGGTCVNNGCVPKKVMWYAAQLAHAVDDAAEFGIPAVRGASNWGRLVAGRDAYIAGLNRYWDGYIEDSGITRIGGYASFVDKRTVEVEGAQYTADHIVIATGSRPIVPALPGAELGITSDGFFELDEMPKRVAVIGGGYIGVELGGMLNALGSKVTLLAREERLLERFDTILGSVLENEMRRQGVQVATGVEVSALAKSQEGIRVSAKDGAKLDGFDSVIWAVGRIPNTQRLNLQAAGVNVLPNGTVPVDAYENTSAPGIYALGDINGKTALTPVAIAAGRRLAERLFNQRMDSRVDYDAIPSVVFSHPPVATVGLTEAQARVRHGDVITVYNSEFTPMRHALNAQGTSTAMKLVCTGENETVVGIHVIGEGADEMMQGFAVALKMGATKADFDRTIPVHPTSAEELVTMKIADDNDEVNRVVDDGLEWKEAG